MKSDARPLVAVGAVLVAGFTLVLILTQQGAIDMVGVTGQRGVALRADDSHPIQAAEAPVSVSAAPSELRAEERLPVKSAVPESVTLSALSGEDKDRLAMINGALKEAGHSPLPSEGLLQVVDLPAFRSIVDAAEKDVDRAERVWAAKAAESLAAERRSVYAKLKSGDTQGLPVESRDNEFKRRHPHEAISLIKYNEASYVLRASPFTNPELAAAGRDYDLNVSRRIETYDSLVRPLVSPPNSGR